MPDVGGVSVGSDLGNTGSGNVGQGPYQLIAPNLGDAVETNINNAIANPGGTLAQVPAAAASAIASGVAFVFQTIGGFLVSFVSGAVKAGASWGSSRVLGLIVAGVVLMVLFH